MLNRKKTSPIHRYKKDFRRGKFTQRLSLLQSFLYPTTFANVKP